MSARGARLCSANDRDLQGEPAVRGERLPLRFVPGAPGLHAVAVRTGDGEEIVIRRAPVGQEMF
ncbi:hypothetical protein [Nocardia brasiliensis]|uniref:hypothetical protein n=1 Tax=Nocardia brasiliensis TaxID=37326 RepID=UPI001E352BA3|nr:hypothetical protein [Nocardia brasiliensis]MBF6131137.1 hypothetical protein [Nocardia brasiliensis]